MYNRVFCCGRRQVRLAVSCVLLLSLLGIAGCAVFGIAAQAMPKYVKAAYPGLKGQKVAIMVVADRGVQLDWSTLSLDLTTLVQMKMLQLQKEDKPEELKETVFPYEPRQMIRYQRDHPDLELTPLPEIAQRISVTRLVYIEVDGLTSRSDMASQLYKGKASAKVKVIEVNGGKAKQAYAEDGITVSFPKNAKEGVLSGTDYAIYRGTLDELSTALVWKFVEHQVE